MNTLQTNDWLILNSIIYEIYTTADFDGMRKKFLEQMKMLVDFDSADFYLAAADGEHKLTARRILWQMRCGQKRSIMTKYISRTDGIIPYR